MEQFERYGNYRSTWSACTSHSTGVFIQTLLRSIYLDNYNIKPLALAYLGLKGINVADVGLIHCSQGNSFKSAEYIKTSRRGTVLSRNYGNFKNPVSSY